MRIGDLATQVAMKLQDEHLDAIEAGEDVVNEEEPMRADLRRSIFAKIEFRWRTADQRILDQIRAGSDWAFKEMFDEAITAMDGIYANLRVPEVNEHGVVIRDSAGRVVWQKDSRGQAVENWSQLTGDDIEKCLFDLTRLRLVLAPQLSELLLEAVFAKHIADDAHQDAYVELLDDTIPARTAYASRKSRSDKYHAFYLYWVYHQADVFMKELVNFCRVLERIRYWRIEDGSPSPGAYRT
jgi:hypothetical protein